MQGDLSPTAMSWCLAPRRVPGRQHYADAVRSWAELLGEPDAAPGAEEESGGRLFSRLRDSLSKSRRALTGELAAAAAFDPGDDADWERLEEALIAGDVGVRATAELVRRLEARGELTDLNAALAEEVAELFGEAPVLDVAHEPAVILVVGVNGTGKTTTIGKLAARLGEHGRSGVVLTKLDGSAKGGVAIPIAYELGLPVKLVGVGEALEDLQPFDPRDYARALIAG